MFDNHAAELDAAATMSLVSSAHELVMEQECHLVELAAHWGGSAPPGQPIRQKANAAGCGAGPDARRGRHARGVGVRRR
jgi:hypothetical protein